MATIPYIPENITVHLGAPDANARNITLPFADYIANVASSEIYPTWPESALRANIYAQISFALNRIYTEYYRSRGYDFDITNSTAIDQSFVYGRDIFENIRQLTEELFPNYIRRQGSVEPLFAAYCDGVRVTCPGLSQWGTVDLARQGLTPYEILTYYYGNDIDIVTNAPVQGITESVPTEPLRLGNVGNNVRTIQVRLNRISDNYPAIPKIAVTDGIFSEGTEDAVRAFQEIFGLDVDGVVGKATWYSIQRIYAAVKRLNSITSEGISREDIAQSFEETLRRGSTGIGVGNLQYYLSYLSNYYGSIPAVSIDNIFGPETEAAVIDAQNTFGLTPDGIVGRNTWNALYNAYLGIVSTIPLKYTEGLTVPFPGGNTLYVLGSEGDAVRLLQEYLNFISQFYPEIPSVNPTGYFGTQTQAAVTAFQRQFGLPANGAVGVVTWNTITGIYEDLYRGNRLGEGQYPGFEIGG